MKKLCVIGNPIKHSLSPKIHNIWIEQNKLDFIYEKKLLEKNQLEGIVKNLKDNNLFGCNVTVPFKQDIIRYVDELSAVSLKTNSVNTLYKSGNKVIGHNTDVMGFQKSLEDLKFNFKNKSVFLIGAGGVSPSIIEALNNLGIGKIIVTNRSEQKLKKLSDLFNNLEFIEWGQIEDADVYINATSVGLEKNSKLGLDLTNIKNKLFYDVIYNPEKTNFLEDAEKNNNRIANGKMMFLYQAQASFKIWTGVEPVITDEVIKTLND
jgi:shikimate dehydrogenase